MDFGLFQSMSVTQRKVRSREYDDYSNSTIKRGLWKNLPYFLLNLLQMIKPFIRLPQGIAFSTR